MKKAEIKEKAHEELMTAMQVAFHSVGDYHDGSYIEDEKERAIILKEMEKQFCRVEKLFGYIPGSWQRGI